MISLLLTFWKKQTKTAHKHDRQTGLSTASYWLH